MTLHHVLYRTFSADRLTMRLVFVFIILLATGCEFSQSNNARSYSAHKVAEQPAEQKQLPVKQVESANLPNVIQVSGTVLSGGEPQNEEAFAELKRLGIKTIVSVDGARPQLELAKKHGLRYVHIPIGYDGVKPEAGGALARVAIECPTPIYVHCHHGKHRGPAAAAVVCMASKQLTAKQSVGYLEQAGTSKDYAGLWRDVENYQPPQPGAKLPELVEVAEVESMAAVMAAVSRHFDLLKLCQKNDWKTPDNHPDVVPAQQALQVEEHLRESNRLLGENYDEQFRTWLSESETAAKKMGEALKADDKPAVAEQFQALGKSCKTCHAAYRN